MREGHPAAQRQLKQPEDFEAPPFELHPTPTGETANVRVEVQRPRASMVNQYLAGVTKK